jgi:arginyl-tRNA--protein-N-Asp/Glu arginylyltransferase
MPITVTALSPSASREQYDLLRRYLDSRHEMAACRI